MAEPLDPKKKSVKPPTPPTVNDAEVEAYEIEEAPAKPPPAKSATVNRSYLVDAAPQAASGGAAAAPKPVDLDEMRLAGARKMMGSSDSGPSKPVAPVDPASAARKREEARKKSAELWAQEEAARKRKKLILAAVVVIAAVACYFIFT